MTALAEMGAVIAPPVPGFYHQPKTIADLVEHSVDRVLDLIGLSPADSRRWDPPESGEQAKNKEKKAREGKTGTSKPKAGKPRAGKPRAGKQ
jgi:hypothetical protein